MSGKAPGFSKLINQLAEASDTSPCTVWRLAKTLEKYLSEKGVPA